ncbi:MAG TPA: hypothetical protein VHO69_01595 [Phototrophicaceae bacterium]|nr:hypothetical protein [Phototrophicaceae bacterium]
MMGDAGRKFEPMYPDVLGAITGGTRIAMDKIQCALGIFPRRTYINQTVEVVLILQSMVDQNMQVKVGLQLPTQDKKGNPVIIETPKKMLSFGMRPGEVGVLHLPIVPLPPTQPGTGFPVRIAVRYRTANENPRPVRPPDGGAPPTVLSISQFKLHALQEVEFTAHTWNQSAEIITAYFDIAPKRLPLANQELKVRYESLWTHEEMANELELVQSKVQDAIYLSAGLTKATVYKPLLATIEERFAKRWMPLHPGEAKAIAKIMTYTLDEGLDLEPGFKMQDSRWFQTLCQMLAHDPNLDQVSKGDLAVDYLFDSALYDAILLGFAVVQPKVKENLGSPAERVNYANRLLNWFFGQGEADLSYVYLPLVLGGLVVNQFVTLRDDNPWIVLRELREAYRGRARLATGEAAVIFQITRALLDDAEDALRRARIPPP